MNVYASKKFLSIVVIKNIFEFKGIFNKNKIHHFDLCDFPSIINQILRYSTVKIIESQRKTIYSIV